MTVFGNSFACLPKIFELVCGLPTKNLQQRKKTFLGGISGFVTALNVVTAEAYVLGEVQYCKQSLHRPAR